MYSETPSILRYAIYGISCLYLFSLIRGVNSYKTSVFCIWVLLILTSTFYNAISGYINFTTTTDDLLIIFLVCIVFCAKFNIDISIEDLRYLFKVLSFFVLALIASEIVNVIFFFDISQGYLNYQSTKVVILFSLVFYLINKKYLFAVVISLLTALILVNYVTRMIILVAMLTIVVYFFLYVFKPRVLLKNTFSVFIIASMIGLFSAWVILSLQTDYSTFSFTNEYKLTSMFIKFSEMTSYSDTLHSLDPVRYAELLVLAEQSLPQLLFGSGLGGAYYDSGNLFGFVGVNDFAFSEEEITSRIFFNFHDLWTDVAFRFGFVPVVVFLLYLTLKVRSPNKQIRMCSILCFLFVFCSFWSKSGILVLFYWVLLIKIVESVESERKLS
ncbi:hypothetical protein WM008_21565 [Vibrio vulnificus]|uniref:hypothetical protein n=1 Tax=Vibrio vulnificus TaxID=672 RepID=UPI001EEB3FCB|nr:hypothetical protein [Vibrio vulnificus]MCG6270844.1 hypothetical protein [Vibrio vulnificus]MCU8185777.1 hypothetical protein [Vibrio vulnificus]